MDCLAPVRFTNAHAQGLARRAWAPQARGLDSYWLHCTHPPTALQAIVEDHERQRFAVVRQREHASRCACQSPCYPALNQARSCLHRFAGAGCQIVFIQPPSVNPCMNSSLPMSDEGRHAANVHSRVDREHIPAARHYCSYSHETGELRLPVCREQGGHCPAQLGQVGGHCWDADLAGEPSQRPRHRHRNPGGRRFFIEFVLSAVAPAGPGAMWEEAKKSRGLLWRVRYIVRGVSDRSRSRESPWLPRSRRPEYAEQLLFARPAQALTSPVIEKADYLGARPDYQDNARRTSARASCGERIPSRRAAHGAG
jgi:hypothetical protein